MSGQMNARWRCLNCRSNFDEPSFSEGPKVFDPATGEVRRFTQSRLLCPVCFSPKLEKPVELAPRPAS